MRRTVLLLVVFLFLGGAAALLLWNKEDSKSTLTGWDRDFAVENTDEIYKIFIADRNGATSTLVRDGKGWLYNDDFKANPNVMENLLDAIRRVEIKFKPPEQMVPNMIKDLASNGIKVEIYDRKEELMKAYYVGGATPDERGTYFIREGAEQPYVVSIPSWEGNVRFRYIPRGMDWRDKVLFEEDPDQIQEVTVEYPKQRNKSFRLNRKGNNFEVVPFYDVTPKIQEPVRKGQVEAFLVGFERLGAESFVNDYPKRDSISGLVPFSVVTVKLKDGEEKWMKTHPIFPGEMVEEERSGLMLGSNEIERYYADCSSGDFMLIQHRVFKKIFWSYDSFF